MPLSDHSGDRSFTIGGNSFRKSTTSGGKDVYERTGGGGSSIGGKNNLIYAVGGQNLMPVIIDDQILSPFFTAGQGCGLNHCDLDGVIKEVLWDTKNWRQGNDPGTLDASGNLVKLYVDWPNATVENVDVYIIANTSWIHKLSYNRSSRSFSKHNTHGGYGIHGAAENALGEDWEIAYYEKSTGDFYMTIGHASGSHEMVSNWDMVVMSDSGSHSAVAGGRNLQGAYKHLPNWNTSNIGYPDLDVTSIHKMFSGFDHVTGRMYYYNGTNGIMEVYQITPGSWDTVKNHVLSSTANRTESNFPYMQLDNRWHVPPIGSIEHSGSGTGKAPKVQFSDNGIVGLAYGGSEHRHTHAESPSGIIEWNPAWT